MMATELSLLALEIQQDNPSLDIDAAWKLAWQQMPELLNDVMMDARYIPRRVVVFDLLTAQELAALTDR
jgi:hypothetical protein